MERSFGEGQPVGLEGGGDSPPPPAHPEGHPEEAGAPETEADGLTEGPARQPGLGEPGAGAGDAAGGEGGEGGADLEPAELDAARPVTDLLDEVGTGHWQHGARPGPLPRRAAHCPPCLRAGQAALSLSLCRKRLPSTGSGRSCVESRSGEGRFRVRFKHSLCRRVQVERLPHVGAHWEVVRSSHACLPRAGGRAAAEMPVWMR